MSVSCVNSLACDWWTHAAASPSQSCWQGLALLAQPPKGCSEDRHGICRAFVISQDSTSLANLAEVRQEIQNI